MSGVVHGLNAPIRRRSHGDESLRKVCPPQAKVVKAVDFTGRY